MTVALALASLTSAEVPGLKTRISVASHDKHVVCYWGTWSTYRKSKGQFTVNNLDPGLCTHIIYSFAGLDTATSKIKSLDPWLDLGDGGSTGRRTFLLTTELKRRNPELKVSLAIGGWNEGSEKYSKMAADPAKRAIFVKSVLKMLRDYNFDGFDLDWEYPGKRGGVPEDKKNFIELIKDLKRSLKPNGLILTAAIGAAPGTIDAAYNVADMYEHLDLVHVMNYDYHGSWDQKTGHNAPLRSDPYATGNDREFSVVYTWEHLQKKGAIASKTVMGVPFYGRTFNLVNPHDARMGARSTKTGFPGPYTKENGFMGYNEICEAMQDPDEVKDWVEEWDETSAAPFAYNGIKWVGYDNPKSLNKKIEFAMAEGMAGIMVWSVDTDDFLGSCGKGRFPLLTSINEALVQHEQSGGSGGSGATSVGGVSQLQSFILAVIVAALTTRWWNH